MDNNLKIKNLEKKIPLYIFFVILILLLYSYRIIPGSLDIYKMFQNNNFDIEFLLNKLFHIFVGVICLLGVIAIPFKRKISQYISSFALFSCIILTFWLIRNDIIGFYNLHNSTEVKSVNLSPFIISMLIIYILFQACNILLLVINLRGTNSKKFYCR